MSGGRENLAISGPLRTVRASCPAYGSSICRRAARPSRRFPSWTAPTVDEDAGEVPGGGITTHHDVGGVVLIKVGVENRLADRTPARLLLKQVSAIEASRFPHQSPKPAIVPVVAQSGIEGTDFALDLHEAGHPGFVVAGKLEPAVTQDPAVPPIDTEVAVDHPVPRLVGMTAFWPIGR